MTNSTDSAPIRRMPVAFLSHGAPTLALDAEKGRDFAQWAAAMPRPRALLVVSAHWEETPVAVGTADPRELMYDFGGFDAALYEIAYRAPGAPELSDEVVGRLPGAVRRPDRMWDHGVWVPLVHMYPAGDVPVLQVSLPTRLTPRELFAIGERLRPLRDRGVLLLASGGMVHNLARLDWRDGGAVPAWASAFDEWARTAIREHDFDAVMNLQDKAPDLRLAHPTLEHILPLLVALGAATTSDRIAFPVGGFEFGSLSRTAVQLG